MKQEQNLALSYRYVAVVKSMNVFINNTVIISNRKEEEKGPVMVHLMVLITLNVILIVQCLCQWINLHRRSLLRLPE